MKKSELTNLIKESYKEILNENKHDGWMKHLQPIIDEYKTGNDEPLDGDEVDSLLKIIKAMINFNEGNITEKEYNKILK